jgi:hypothetical protein
MNSRVWLVLIIASRSIKAIAFAFALFVDIDITADIHGVHRSELKYTERVQRTELKYTERVQRTELKDIRQRPASITN